MSPRLHVFMILSLLLAVPAAAKPPAPSGGTFTIFEGLIEPSEIVNVGSPVEGVVDHLVVERSFMVAKGDPLIYLEASVERATFERARSMAAAEGEVKTHEEKLAHARRMHARVSELFKSEAISAEKKDEAATEMALANSRLQKAKEDKMLAKLDFERTQAQLEQKVIRSPLTGVVVERLVAPGEYVGGKPLMRVAQLDPLRVEVILPSSLFGKVGPGMRADVKPEGHQDSYVAIVTIVDRVIDPASNTFGVRLELPNPDYRLPSGLKCSVHFTDSISSESAPESELPTRMRVDPKVIQQKSLHASQ